MDEKQRFTFFLILGFLVFFTLIWFISVQYNLPSTERYSRMDTMPNFRNRDKNRTVPTPGWFNTFGPQFGVPRWIETDPPQPFADLSNHTPVESSFEQFSPGETSYSDTNNVLPPFQVENSTYWPSYYYAFPYDKSTYAWPPGMFSRSYNWYPGFSSGSGESYYKRPNNENSPRPRNAWIRNTNVKSNDPYYFVSNRGEYQFNQDNYQGF